MKVRGQTVYSHKERIMRMSEEDTETGCWNWKGTTRGGYGRLIIGSRSDDSRRSVSAHRLSHETFIGPIPDGMEVCHRCDNRRCVNPGHLFAGSRQDNVDDREAKGRNVVPVGEANGTAKLSEADVISARRLRAAGHTYQSVADRFCVSKRTIMNAIKGESWAHVPAAPALAASTEQEVMNE